MKIHNIQIQSEMQIRQMEKIESDLQRKVKVRRKKMRTCGAKKSDLEAWENVNLRCMEV